MIPDRCSIREEGKRCVNPPGFVVSVVSESDEYMIGVTCNKHRQAVTGKIGVLQGEGKIPSGKVNFEVLKAVGTDCVNGSCGDDLVQIDGIRNA
ncbi:hypothetical protein CENSYa_0315 [Cenarchaeum symbiosum A]|uniref:Uncharacterized protein n=1 Tax=Cenarchaeum symbiosum (strain A) TaxID=414004 RepID=A0RUD5_CENSY|nr:hypothetical protein CENSYa_0315 [Cenarchaeum symbiosum A]